MRHLVTATPRAFGRGDCLANTAKVADSVKAGTITTDQLNEQILKYFCIPCIA